MNKRDFLKNLGLGSLTIASAVVGVSKIKEVVDGSLINNIKKTTTNVPEELSFHILKDGEVFHPIHKEYKVNRNGEVSYINYHNKVFICKLNKHKVTGQLAYRLKHTNVMANRFVFEAFTQTKLTQSYIVIPKDGNHSNISIDNLQCIRKKDYHGYKILETRSIIRGNDGRIITYS